MTSVSIPAAQSSGPTTAPASKPRSLPAHVLGRARVIASRIYRTLTEKTIAARGNAALRIGYGGLWVLFLLREIPERDIAWGPNAPWTPAMERQYFDTTRMPNVIRDWYLAVSGLSNTDFQLFYLAAIVAGVLFAVGWHTRATSLLFAFVVVALENRTPMLTDGGDNVLLLMCLYLCATRCGRHWSLDARRERLRRDRLASAATAEPAPRPLPDWLAELAAVREQAVNLMHNGVTLVIAFQVCVIYEVAGMYKVQGGMWQEGTALTYILQLHWFQPWPALSHLVIQQTAAMMVFGYVTVFAQVGFPFAVFSPKLKYPSLVILTMMHLGIAVLMGLPFFSLIMLTGDMVFIPDRVWIKAGRLLGPRLPRPSLLTGRRGRPAQGEQTSAPPAELIDPVLTPAAPPTGA